jgi:sulfatase maturation enzyme AslB (radical SAM superfamily)
MLGKHMFEEKEGGGSCYICWLVCELSHTFGSGFQASWAQLALASAFASRVCSRALASCPWLAVCIGKQLGCNVHMEATCMYTRMWLPIYLPPFLTIPDHL